MASARQRKIWFLVIIVPLALLFIYFSRSVLTPFILAFFLAYAINPLVEFFQKRGARRDYAVLTVYLIILILMLIIIWLIVPRLIKDLTEVSAKLPRIMAGFERIDADLTKIYWRLPDNIQSLVTQLTNRAEIVLRNFLTRLIAGLIGFLSQFIIYLLVPLLAYYINRDYPKMKQAFYQWLVCNLGNHWTRTFLKIDALFRAYIRGQLTVTLIMALLFGLGLSILGVEAAFLLGLAAAVFNLIPYFGPIIGAFPAIIFALLHSPWLALYVILLFAVVNQLEVMVLTPRIIGGGMGLHPVTVIYLILMGGKLFGVMGMVFAVPLGSIFLILFKSIYELAFGLANQEPLPAEFDFGQSESD